MNDNISTGIRHNVRSVDSLEFGTYQTQSDISEGLMDTFELAESKKKEIVKNEVSKLLKIALMEIVGERNYSIYYLNTVHGIRLKTIAKHFGIALSTTKRINCEVKTSLDKLLNNIRSYDKVIDNMELLAYDLTIIDKSTKIEVKGERVDFDFDFEEMTKQYYSNIDSVEHELDLNNTLEGWE